MRGNLADVISSSIVALGSTVLVVLHLKRQWCVDSRLCSRIVCLAIWLLFSALVTLRTLIADDTDLQHVSLTISQLMVVAMFILCATSPLGGKLAALVCSATAVVYLVTCGTVVYLRENQVYGHEQQLIVSSSLRCVVLSLDSSRILCFSDCLFS